MRDQTVPLSSRHGVANTNATEYKTREWDELITTDATKIVG